MPLQAQIITEALTWQGTPWHHRACCKGVGVDCVRLMEGIAKAVGVLPSDWAPPAYSPQWHLHRNQELLQEVLAEVGMIAVSLPDRRPADVLGFQFGRVVSHMAILVTPHYILHAVRDLGRVTQHGLQGEWLARLRVVYRFPGVAL